MKRVIEEPILPKIAYILVPYDCLSVFMKGLYDLSCDGLHHNHEVSASIRDASLLD